MASTLSDLLIHLVFSTKNREARITAELQPDLYAYLGGIVRSEKGSALAIGGMPDHVHLLVRFHPDLPVSTLVRKLKAKSSRWVKQRKAGDPRFAWQSGYGAFSVSGSQAAAVRRYIANQTDHHRKRTFPEEYLALLEKHGIEFDERYVLG
jgi:putative transposase